MKKIIFLMSSVGIFINPLFGSPIFEKSTNPEDTYTLQSGAGQSFSSIEEVNAYLESQSYSMPSDYERKLTNLGWAWTIDNAQVENMTNATGLGFGNSTYLIGENNTTSPKSFLLEKIIDNAQHQGPPTAFNVQARQLPGTKNVQIDCFVAIGYDPGSFSDKPTDIEFWFKGNPSSLQWEKLTNFDLGGSYTGPGTLAGGGPITAVWRAGEEKPNFKTTQGKIRVLLSYHRDEAGMNVTGSGWDGYEAENGPNFSRKVSDPMVAFNDQVAFNNMILDNGIQRIGSYQGTQDLMPVYQFTTVQLSDLTGTSGIPDGKYAYGLEEDANFPGTSSFFLIPVN